MVIFPLNKVPRCWANDKIVMLIVQSLEGEPVPFTVMQAGGLLSRRFFFFFFIVSFVACDYIHTRRSEMGTQQDETENVLGG